MHGMADLRVVALQLDEACPVQLQQLHELHRHRRERPPRPQEQAHLPEDLALRHATRRL